MLFRSAIFERYFGQIHQFLAARVGPKIADDLAAEVFAIAFAQRQRYDLGRNCARPWLYGIANNLASAHRRQEQRRYRLMAKANARETSLSEEDLVADRVSAWAVRPALAAALAALDAGDRDVLLLVALAGLGNQEVAQALGIPYGTVCSRLSRARRRLREALGGANPASANPAGRSPAGEGSPADRHPAGGNPTSDGDPTGGPDDSASDLKEPFHG